MAEPVLTLSHLSKSFGALKATDDVSLTLRPGEIHALIGPNGAGKSTLIGQIAGRIQPDAGTITFRGRDITGLPPAEIARLGVVRSFQISAVFPNLTAMENVRIALQRRRGESFDFWRSERVLGDLRGRAMELLRDVGLEAYAATSAGKLPYGRKRALEIATTLALDPEMLLLDEPMAGMAEDDVERIARLVRRISQTRTILMVEHNLSVVAALSDHITVLARGAVLAEGDYATVSKDPRVVEAYIGAGHG